MPISKNRTGINGDHEDLRNRVNAQLSRDFIANTNGLVDPHGHGTHVAGTIGAQGNNGIGISGVNWDVQLVALRVLNDFGAWGPLERVAVANAVDHARINNIPILNASVVIGYHDSVNQPIRDAVASYSGLFVQSAENYRSNTNNNPRFEGFPNVIVVGSTDRNDNMSNFTNWGSTSTHIFAPGTDILSTMGIGYAETSGTSMAAPHVAGVAALLLSREPSLSMEQQRAFILESADRLPQLSGMSITGGRLNAYEALKCIPIIITATAVTVTTVDTE